MFKTKTLFVLGAGSSNEIGFPLGSDLKVKIADALSFRFEYGQRQGGGDSEIYDALLNHVYSLHGDHQHNTNQMFQAAKKIARAMPQATSIDNYLEAHSHDEAIVQCAKLAIARTILNAEADSALLGRSERPDQIDHDLISKTWYGRFFEMLVEGVSKKSLDGVLRNVSFITFNYDRSIERYLPLAIDNYYDCGLTQAQDLVRAVKIFHPYGICGNLPSALPGRSIPYGGSDFSGELLEVGKNLQTFSEQVSDQKALKEMRDEFASADVVVFLGFAFHEMNVKLLSTPDCLARRVFATAFGISQSGCQAVENRITRMLGKLPEIELRNDLKCAPFLDEYRLSLL